jgi:enoyl-CoA hydratase/carnithine racemase
MITTDLRSGVLHVTLARPEKKNALTLAMYDGLTEALARAAEPDVRVVLLAGAEGVFTAGNDLSDFVMNPPSGEDSPVFRFLEAVSAFEKPLVAAVAGPAVGIGTTVLLHCDLVYAAPSARFALPFVNLGLCPEAASSYLLPLTVGMPKAAEWLLFGEPFGAEEAERAGLVNAVVPEGDLLAHATARAEALAAKPPASVRLTKHFLREGHRQAVRQAMRAEAEAFLQRLQSEEAAEAFTAFFEKRPPDFARFT